MTAVSERICSVDDCDRRHYGRSFCRLHYQRWRKHGDPLSGAMVRNPEICTIDGCEKRCRTKGLCPMHYQRERITGTTDPAPKRPRKTTRRVGVYPCVIDGCAKVQQARGWCSAHYSRWLRFGNAEHHVRGEIKQGRRVCPHCKVAVPVEDWYVTPNGKFILCGGCFGEWNRARGHMRRAHGGVYFSRIEILKRDDWTCGICLEGIDPALKYPDPLSASLDHIHPLSRGGQHAPENTQAAHLDCNRRKWAKVESI